MAEYTVRLYFRGGMTLDVPITLADDEEPDLEWFLGESSEPTERTSVLSEGQFAWKASEVIAAEWYEDVPEVVTTPDAEPIRTEAQTETGTRAESEAQAEGKAETEETSDTTNTAKAEPTAEKKTEE